MLPTKLDMKLIGITIAAIVVLTLAVSAYVTFGSGLQSEQGTVSRSGPIGVEGTYFTLMPSGKRFYCFWNTVSNCAIVTDGGKVSITYLTNGDGERSVQSLDFITSSVAFIS